jgi:hypothetical protein
MLKFADVLPGAEFHSHGVNYTKLSTPEDMTNNCTCGIVNASHRGKGVVQFVFFDEATLVTLGHITHHQPATKTVIPFKQSKA